MNVALSWILTEMGTFQTISTIAEADKVKFLDLAIKSALIDYKLPHRRKKTTLRVFADVEIYAPPTDYDEMAFLDNDEEQYENRARFRFQSFNEFLEDKDYRNDLAEIYDNGDVFIGCRYEPIDSGNRQINNCEDATDFSVSGDATAVADETVFYKEGSGSVKLTIVNSTGTATVEYSFTSFSDSDYKKKYKFLKIYLDGAPSAITIRFGNSASAYVYKQVTTQFDGRAFVADDWNIIAIDLNEATAVGTIVTTAFDYGAIIFTDAPSGTYYIDDISLKEWELIDLWYYSKNAVKLADGTYQEAFYNLTTESYATDSELVGPREWANYIELLASYLCAIDKNDVALKTDLIELIEGSPTKNITGARKKLEERYPAIKYLITNTNWRFSNSPLDKYVGPKTLE